MLAPVCPFDHSTVQPLQVPLAVSVTDSPAHKAVGPLAVRVGAAGNDPCVKVIVLEITVCPHASVTITEYEPALVTVVLEPDCPLDHTTKQLGHRLLAVKVTLCPLHIVVVPFDEVTTGIGSGPQQK